MSIDVTDIHNSSKELITKLLNGELISYTDDRFPVSSNGNQYIFKLAQKNNACSLSYFHIPHGYPIPHGLQEEIESQIKMSPIHWINMAAEANKERILRASAMETPVVFKEDISKEEAIQIVLKSQQQQKPLVNPSQKSSLFKFFKPKVSEGTPSSNPNVRPPANRFKTK